MSKSWREVLEDLDVTTTPAAGPGGAAGDWHQLLAAFGTRGFLRALTDGSQLAIECAPPGDVEQACEALERGGWRVDARQAPFAAAREFPTDLDLARSLWVSIAQLADAVRNEDMSAFVAAAAPQRTAAPEPEVAPPAGAQPASPAGGFEEIGAHTELPTQETPFAFVLEREAEVSAVDVMLGFSEALDAGDYGALERRLVGNLRGKYDVNAVVIGAHEVKVQLTSQPRTRVALRVTAAPGSGLNVRAIEDAVGTYFQTLADLATSGIDPLVFLGARASRRNTGAFEAIGAPEPAGAPAEGAPTATLLVDDGEPDIEPDAEEVVFTAPAAEPDPDAPLEAGRFDDARLKRADATTALVDVVLRHPGYSDRSIGQVLSILLSIDYASCLDLSARAPTVISWGVARERALTMKTVIEGAGGRVVLVEPGTFGAA